MDYNIDGYGEISTHVPRAGDDRPEPKSLVCLDISTHVPRAGDDSVDRLRSPLLRLFQPTSPVRETTIIICNIP